MNQPPLRKSCGCAAGMSPRHLALFLATLGILASAGVLLEHYNQAARAEGRDERGHADSRSEPSALLGQFDTSNLNIDRKRILAGGPPKDGIPSLTDPKTEAAKTATFLRASDRVVGVTVKGSSRAYPISVLNYHEAINDTLGGTPIAVIYCPLCDSVSVVDRRLDGQTYEFGISGLLYNSNVLLYDRQDDALWSQVGLQAVSGPNAGKSLTHLPFTITRYGDWRKDHSQEGTVCTLDTGHVRNYKRNPYARYFRSDELMFPARLDDERLELKERVIGVKTGDVARAYPIRDILGLPGGTLRDEIDGKALVVKVEGAPSWPTVRLKAAPPDARVVHTFWFAWAAFHPETEIRRPSVPLPTSEQAGR